MSLAKSFLKTPSFLKSAIAVHSVQARHDAQVPDEYWDEGPDEQQCSRCPQWTTNADGLCDVCKDELREEDENE